jgi:hypothetical protein
MTPDNHAEHLVHNENFIITNFNMNVKNCPSQSKIRRTIHCDSLPTQSPLNQREWTASYGPVYGHQDAITSVSIGLQQLLFYRRSLDSSEDPL